MKPSTLIIIGIACVVVGLVPPVGWLCIMSGLFCLYFGITRLDKEAKEEENGSEDGDKEGPV